MIIKELKTLISKYPDEATVEIETDEDTHEDFTVGFGYDTVVLKVF